MSSFYQISLTASFDILCSDPLNLKIKDAKGEHKKIFCGRVRSPRPAPPRPSAYLLPGPKVEVCFPKHWPFETDEFLVILQKYSL